MNECILNELQYCERESEHRDNVTVDPVNDPSILACPTIQASNSWQGQKLKTKKKG